MPRLSKIGAAALAAFGWTGLNTVSASYLVVAGGGGGGASSPAGGGGGGGGAGGYRTGTASINPTQSYTVTVGAGGAAGTTGGSGDGTIGADSVFSTITSTGGGLGSKASGTGGNGGSGGGGGDGAGATNAGGTGNTPSTSPSQGSNGGSSASNAGGGGGGASAVGANANTGTSAGAGGAGSASSITGTSVTYAGGGGGGMNNANAGTAGAAGAGGGGAGGKAAAGTAGTANLGGGGGGGGRESGVQNFNGGQGGSGVVIISYVGAQQFGGGVVTSSGGNTIHTFQTSGTLSPLSSLTASTLVVAGGGGGGFDRAGGGGAGGFRTGSGITIDTNSIYLVTVGAGGSGSSSGANKGSSGSDSVFLSTTSTGGGGGGSGSNAVGANGGSGGGSRDTSSGGAGSGNTPSTSPSQGNNGGSFGDGSSTTGTGGGGGGAGAVGSAGKTVGTGIGGAGTASSISGTSTTYAGGGGGGGGSTAGGSAGGSGGGGAGGNQNSAGTAGTANLGGGGGGGGDTSGTGGTGGSGVVIISYAGSVQQMAGGTVTVAGGNVIHTFTSSGYLAPIYSANNSLRTRSSASAYLSKTFSTVGNTQKFTESIWIKRGTLGANQYFGFNASGSATYGLFLDTSDILNVYVYYTGSVWQGQLITTQVFRDPAAWYHFVLAVDTTQATSTDRIKLYVNGLQVTSFSTANYPNLNQTINWNTAGTYAINAQFDGTGSWFDGYTAELNYIDGQQLTPNSFGTSNGLGVWQPIRYGGSYGTNGFYLPFTNTTSTTTLGYDFSPNGNNWTTNNISLTAGSTYDSMTDVPTNTSATVANYAVLNPLWSLGGSGYITPTNGNLRASIGGTYNIIASTIPLPSTGKWYMEFTLTTGVYAEYGLCSATASGGGTNAGVFAAYYNGAAQYALINGSFTLTDGNQAWVSGDIGLIAVDVDNNKVWLGRNRSGTVVWMGGGDPSAGTSPSFSASGGGGVYSTAFNAQTFNNPFVASGGGSDVWDANFGQQPFVGTPPTNFLRLNTFNLPTPTIGATAATTANKYMDATTYTGNSGTQSITNSGSFQPDLVWMKARNNANYNWLTNSVTGSSEYLSSNDTIAARTGVTDALTAFNSNGFALGANTSDAYVAAGVNYTGRTYVAWQWRASNATAVTNTAGSITSTVSANTTAGFSIVTYTGTGGTGTTTVGHGLGVSPSMVIIKRRNSTTDWASYHTGLTSTSYYLVLNSTAAQANYGSTFISPSSSTLTIAADSSLLNTSTGTYVAYCFAQVAGYSAFGSYTGNGSTDGPFIYTGFRPRFVIIKASSISGENWYIVDATRSPYNAAILYLSPNSSGAEASPGAAQFFDFLSNGFKLRVSGSYANSSGATYIYMAFAENPFKYANAR
jgi:hypothetical protein